MEYKELKDIAWRFTERADPDGLKEMSNHPVPVIVAKILKGEKISQEDKDYLMARTTEHNGMAFRYMGWSISLYLILKCYWVKLGQGDIVEVYALNKTAIRNSAELYSIQKIVEIK